MKNLRVCKHPCLCPATCDYGNKIRHEDELLSLVQVDYFCGFLILESTISNWIQPSLGRTVPWSSGAVVAVTKTDPISGVPVAWAPAGFCFTWSSVEIFHLPIFFTGNGLIHGRLRQASQTSQGNTRQSAGSPSKKKHRIRGHARTKPGEWDARMGKPGGKEPGREAGGRVKDPGKRKASGGKGANVGHRGTAETGTGNRSRQKTTNNAHATAKVPLSRAYALAKPRGYGRQPEVSFFFLLPVPAPVAWMQTVIELRNITKRIIPAKFIRDSTIRSPCNRVGTHTHKSRFSSSCTRPCGWSNSCRTQGTIYGDKRFCQIYSGVDHSFVCNLARRQTDVHTPIQLKLW